MSLPPLADDLFWRTLAERRSLRQYDGRPVPRPLLERLLTAAVWAPNAHNRQPWRFAVVTERERQEHLAQALARRWYADLIADGYEANAAARRVARSQQRLGKAGALVLGCITMSVMDTYPDTRRQSLEWLMATQSLALALGQLLLAAHHEGLAACWMCAPLFAPEIVTAILDLPADWEPQALITLGYPDPTAKPTPPKNRLPLNEVVIWR
jgi:F420 biosynthesis protein FbiB-like protein